MSDILKAPVYEGRPKLGEGRLEKEIRTYDLLDRLAISYLRLDHEAMPTIEACRDVDKRLQIHICKNLFLCNSGKTDFYLLLMPGEKKFHTREVSSQLGVSRLSFAPELLMNWKSCSSAIALSSNTSCSLLLNRQINLKSKNGGGHFSSFFMFRAYALCLVITRSNCTLL